MVRPVVDTRIARCRPLLAELQQAILCPLDMVGDDIQLGPSVLDLMTADSGVPTAMPAADVQVLLEASVPSGKHLDLAKALRDDPVQVVPAPSALELPLGTLAQQVVGIQAAQGQASQQDPSTGHDEVSHLLRELPAVAHVEVVCGVQDFVLEVAEHRMQVPGKHDRVVIHEHVVVGAGKLLQEPLQAVHVRPLRAPPRLGSPDVWATLLDALLGILGAVRADLGGREKENVVRGHRPNRPLCRLEAQNQKRHARRLLPPGDLCQHLQPICGLRLLHGQGVQSGSF
mmetsp:Transcript_146001/g.468183  ORF Transcript_146001/g.468183 Transcript_146001/m.468183 type:complete len:286 (+) Transcript_146001:244-1101(+)